MLKLLIALASFVAPAIHAAEILYANYPQQAPVSHAGLLVWTEEGDLRITRLGLHGQVVATHTVDLGEAELSTPSVASDGESYLVAFVHRKQIGVTNLAVVPVDAAGAPGVVRTYGPLAEGKAPSLIRIAGAYAVWSERRMYRLDGNGLVLTESEGRPGPGLAAAGGALLTFSTTTDPGGRRCGIGFGRGCAVFPAVTTIDWSYSSPAVVKSGSLRRPWSMKLELVAAGNDDGTEFVIAWIGETDPDAIVVREGEGAMVKVQLGNISMTPAIASDGSSYLLVFQSLGGIRGAFIDPDEAIAHPFPIVTTTGLPEERPAVTALARGRFLVTYRSGSALAGRVVVTPAAVPSRRRSVR